MKHVTWFSVTLMLAHGLLACGSDDPVDGSATAGSGTSTAGSPAAGSPANTGGSPGAAGSGGAAAGSSNAGTGGSSAAAGGSSAGTGGSAAGAAGTGGDAALKDIVDTAVAAGSFTKLAEALTTADLVTALKGTGPFTVFAPTDKAFADFETAKPGALAKLTKDELAAVLEYHVVAAAALSTQLKDDQVFKTLNGSPVLVDLTSGVKVGVANVTMADVKASNGVIHVIDEILLPPESDIVATAIAAGNFTKLAGALTSAGLVDTLKGPGPFTVFAPTDAAFDKLGTAPTGDALKNVLLYHVVSGAVGSGDLAAGKVPTLLETKSVDVALNGGVTVNGAKVTTANIIAKNGVIHVVDTVLVPQ